MKSKSMRIALLSSLIAVVAIGMISVASVQAQTILQGYPTTGRVVGTVSTGITKTINMHGGNQLVLVLQASGGNFGSKFLIISASADNTNFVQVDNVSLSTNTIAVKQYDATHLGSGAAINPAVFPFVKVAQSAGNSGVTPTLTYSGR